MSLLQLICFFLQKTAPEPDQLYLEADSGYFFFDEDTGDIHKI